MCIEGKSKNINMYFNGTTLNVGSKLAWKKIAYNAVMCFVYFEKSEKKKQFTWKSREAIISRIAWTAWSIHQRNEKEQKGMKRKEKVMTQVVQKPKQKYLLNVLYIKFFGDDKSEK